MIGAGIFVAFAPAAEAAGAGLLLGLVLAAAVAYCNAMSSARLAALFPQSGGTYVYARERLGHLCGYVAGWSFVVGKIASCAAIALTFGHYLAPSLEHPVAAAAVLGLTLVNLRGIEKTALVTRLIVGVVLLALAAFISAALVGGGASSANLSPLWPGGSIGILRAGAFLFFAFAGYARIATLGEEVVDPSRTIRRAIPLALALTFVIYGAVAVVALAVVGPTVLAATATPLKTVLAAKHSAFVPAVQIGAAVGSVGVLLSLLAGVSRTTFAMARNGDLPHLLGAVAPRRRVPHHAELAVAAIAATVAGFTDIRGAIGFSSFCVLCYYALANASALTLGGARFTRIVAAVGFVGCAALACALPLVSILSGVAVVVSGMAAHLIRRQRTGAVAAQGSEPTRQPTI